MALFCHFKKIQAIPMNSRQWKLKILLLVGRRRTARWRQPQISSERLVNINKRSFRDDW
jgi:hypothetical protein